MSIITVSAALALSPIPWKGPVGSIRMGYVKPEGETTGEFLANPGGAELALSELDVVATQTKEKTLMLEAGARQVPENIVLEAIKKAHDYNKEIISFIEDFIEKAEAGKKTAVKPQTTLLEYVAKIEKTYKKEISDLVALRASNEGGSSADQDAIIEKIYADFQAEGGDTQPDKKLIAKAVEKVFFGVIRENIIKKGERPDKRKIDEIRPISVEVGILPRTHGSAIFQRGDTQVLSIATLGAARLEQLIESAEGEEKKRYIHHYSFPPYSVGEVGRIGFLSRREIGHGALAERALEAVIPPASVFPYTIRVVSEVLSSNGSTSMASTCGSTLALMDAGVPITKPVAGVAMGMMSNDKEYVILTDILGLEDFSGDMDFKVTGTDAGVTAIQLDVKTLGLTFEQIGETFERAKTGRIFILDKMQAVMPASRNQVSEFAPKINVIKIPVEKIGEVIGPGGRVIKNIIATTGAQVDVDDDGTVSISGVSEEEVQAATDWINGFTRVMQAGEVFENAEVKRILPFGAFVEFLPGKEGMVHVSQMSAQYVKDPNEVVHIGDKVKVRVLEVDQQGRVNLSMLFGEDAKKPVAPRGERSERPQRPMGDARPQHPLARQFQRERNEQRKDFKKRF